MPWGGWISEFQRKGGLDWSLSLSPGLNPHRCPQPFVPVFSPVKWGSLMAFNKTMGEELFATDLKCCTWVEGCQVGDHPVKPHLWLSFRVRPCLKPAPLPRPHGDH